MSRLFERITDAVLCLDREWRCTYVNARAGQLAERDPQAMLGQVLWEQLPRMIGSPLAEALHRAMASGEPEVLTAASTSVPRMLEHRLEPFADGIAVVSIELSGPHSDLTPLAERSRYLRTVLETAPECVGLLGRDGRLVDINRAGLEMLDAPTLAVARTRTMPSLVDAADRAAYQALHEAALHGASGRLEFGLTTFAGRPRRHETHAAPLRDASGTVVGALHVTRDVTERRESEERLRTSERFSHLLLEASPDCIKVLDLSGRLEHVNGPGLRLLEADGPDAICGQEWGSVWEGETASIAAAAMDVARSGETARFSAAAPTLKGTPKYWDVTLSPVRDDAGTIVKLLAVSRDMTVAKRAEDRLRESEARFRRVSEGAPLGIFMNDADGRTVYANERMAQIVGRTTAELLGDGWKGMVYSEDQTRILAAREDFREGEDDRQTFDYRVARADGSLRTVVVHVLRLRRLDGRADGFVGMVEDTTDRRALEQQLRQAQKMEAVGQLAGGVAHDFNNLLTIIGGHLDFAREDLAPLLPAEHTVQKDLAEIAQAADRARALVRQLLTFSRKQVVTPKAVDVNAIVRGTEQLLHRVLGDEIVLGTTLSPEALVVRADALQLEQVLVNLGLNARDAMLTTANGRAGTGGALTIETDVLALGDGAHAWPDLPAGPYVRLSVTDTGHGMDDATRAHLFEPFFTTKPVGAGTGLGLATVYGIVQQARGAIRVRSAPGAGATFTILLPRIALPASTPVERRADVRAAGRGTILVVEDEPAVRATTRRLLERHGYAVLEARHGVDALQCWREAAAAITAVVTDLRMPEMGGRELVARLRAERSGLPVVFVSGDSDGAAGSAIGPNERFLEKPFTGDALLAALDAASVAGARGPTG